MAINREIARTPAQARRDARRKEKLSPYLQHAEIPAEHLPRYAAAKNPLWHRHAKIQPGTGS